MSMTRRQGEGFQLAQAGNWGKGGVVGSTKTLSISIATSTDKPT